MEDATTTIGSAAEQVVERERLPDRADDEQWECSQAQPTELLQPTDVQSAQD